jgi:hypothetical protein
MYFSSSPASIPLVTNIHISATFELHRYLDPEVLPQVSFTDLRRIYYGLYEQEILKESAAFPDAWLR